ncbi:aminotransferase class I/II-fold pyridoxal phosphate-dependent enzyme [Cytophagaceae bacterium 50C-KIRBA]|uniref:Aminotransferase class I/II-fold pyridoxal phosphate-dependent enzyme n=1 Tax=Aquirufa beregesia TaxID=2516556 RepID=A0ABX0ETZ6_9BACT|nr:DegT/DnrJ/EryC1/StrS family aminotransferase [Aquirufa beregesia]NGZ43523.1 aminotransferase class I/II-fold pyridoxal phosphate-dependent enzyme [Aquirufa beregesia]
MKTTQRRQFLKQSGLLSAAAVLPALQGKRLLPQTHKQHIPAILGGKSHVKIDNWIKWPIWDSENDEKLLLEVMRSGVWSRAQVVNQFEKAWADTIGTKRCMTVVNGTQALTVAINQAKLGPGDEILVTPYTFIASIQAILANSCIPIFVDVDPETFQMDTKKIEARISRRTKAILPVHILGLPCDMVQVMEIAKKHQLIVIEDACQAPLAEINHQKVGSFGLAGCFSFQNSKNIAIGEGGAIISNDEGFMDRCYSYHNLGLPFGIATGSISSGSFMRGTKVRFTEYQAAIGLAQLTRLESQTQVRNERAAYLSSMLKNIPGVVPYRLYPEVTRAAFHLYPFRYQANEFKGLSRSNFLKALQAEGVPCSGGYTALNTQVFLQEAFESTAFKKLYSRSELNYSTYLMENQCPLNNQLCEEAIWFTQNLLLGSKEDMELIFQSIQKIHREAESIKKKLQP